MVFERMKKIRSKWRDHFEKATVDHGLPVNDEDVMHSISLNQAIKYVSKVGHARVHDLSEWVVSYIEDRAAPEVKVKSVGPMIHNDRKNVSKAHILEAI